MISDYSARLDSLIYSKAEHIQFQQQSHERNAIQVLHLNFVSDKILSMIIERIPNLKQLKIKQKINNKEIQLIGNIQSLVRLKIAPDLDCIKPSTWSQLSFLEELEIFAFNSWKPWISAVAQSIPNLKSLGWIQSLKKQQLSSLRKLKSLRQIKFNGLELTTQKIRSIVEFMPALVSFSFINCYFTNDELRVLVRIVPNLISLDAGSFINRQYCNILDDSSLKILSQYSFNLQKLNLSEHTRIKQQSLVVLSSSISHFKELCFVSTPMSVPTMRILSANLQQLLKLKVVNFNSVPSNNYNELIKNMNQLQELEINYCDDQTIMIIYYNLKNLRVFTADFKYTRKVSEEISPAGSFLLSKIKSLRVITIRRTRIDHRNIIKVFKNIKKGVVKFTNPFCFVTKMRRNVCMFQNQRQKLVYSG